VEPIARTYCNKKRERSMSKYEIENGLETSSQVSQISQMKADVIIVGSSISGLMTSCYLRQKLPYLNILVIGPRPEQEKRAYIGESLTEISIHFFWEIGLKDYLDRTRDLKNGLTFYHKLRIDDPNDYRYSVHAPGESLYYHSRQLNRPIFDRDLWQHAVQMGVQFLDGKVKEVNIGEGQHRHQAIVKTTTGECIQLSARSIPIALSFSARSCLFVRLAFLAMRSRSAIASVCC
jgi:2-polyprenyl-6-methoxyphenol hydroxylase-like FAD-dependent oxidoreductase